MIKTVYNTFTSLKESSSEKESHRELLAGEKQTKIDRERVLESLYEGLSIERLLALRV